MKLKISYNICMSKFQKDHTINLGKKHSKSTREKMSDSHKGKVLTEQHKQRIGKYRLGKKQSLSVKEKIRKTLLGKPLSEERKKKISEAHRGLKHSEEHKKKISKALKGIIRPRGEKHHLWKGGISFEPYNVDWTSTLRRSIRERDHYICQLCNSYGKTVHHIDYDKKNCDPKNLINLCRKCNSKVNYNRKYWKDYFQTLLEIQS